MAFRQPTLQSIHKRPATAPEQSQPEVQTHAQTQSQQLQVDSQEWILFDPSTASTTNRTYSASTAQTRTAGRSRLSDFGSVDTAARSYGYDEGAEGEEDDDHEEEEDGGEDGELDSLDSHLLEFRAEPSIYRSAEANGAVLPTHDGLGSFRLHRNSMGEDIEQHLYAFERFNPRRLKRRREGIHLNILELESDRVQEAERVRRIERWRMEQSKILVDEIQRETRRQKHSMSSRSTKEDLAQEDMATLNDTGNLTPDIENQSFWNRITRRVIRDLMGLDDNLLSIIFGESLLEKADSTPKKAQNLLSTNAHDKSSWEYKVLERISRELGFLVNQITDHPGPFSTYLGSPNLALPYAGLSVIPEGAKDLRQQPPVVMTPKVKAFFNSSPTSPSFKPTIPMASMPIISKSTSLSNQTSHEPDRTPHTYNSPLALSHEEWERDLDLKMVFRYLRDRVTTKFRSSSTYSSSPPPPSSTTPDSNTSMTNGSHHLATTSTADLAARAARVRAHHPLVSGRPPVAQKAQVRTWKVSIPAGSVTSGGVSVVGRTRRGSRGSGSCASEFGNGGKISGSSRHYWDWAGSVDSGGGGGKSLTGGANAGAGMGSWGEV